MFQDFKLLKRKTIIENVAFVLRILGVPAREQKRRAFAALKAVGLHHKMHAYPLQLSGGEQQRVAIARALINEPMLLLADEPTGNLDPDMAQEIMRLFLEVNARGTTVVVATHDRDMMRVHDAASRDCAKALAEAVGKSGWVVESLSPRLRATPGVVEVWIPPAEKASAN